MLRHLFTEFGRWLTGRPLRTPYEGYVAQLHALGVDSDTLNGMITLVAMGMDGDTMRHLAARHATGDLGDAAGHVWTRSGTCMVCPVQRTDLMEADCG